MTCAAADRNEVVAAAANDAAPADVVTENTDNDDNCDAVSTNAANDLIIKHNRSASEGDATASACNNDAVNVAGGGMMDNHVSASVGEQACASSIAVAVEMHPRVAWRDGRED